MKSMKSMKKTAASDDAKAFKALIREAVAVNGSKKSKPSTKAK
jgi:hypothetical protein